MSATVVLASAGRSSYLMALAEGLPVSCEVHVSISSDPDILVARQKGRAMAAQLGFLPPDPTIIATVISELGRNIVLYAREGEISLRPLVDVRDDRGLIIVARDRGPGIPNIRQALRDGYSTSGSLGLGLPGVKRLMDEFAIASEPNRGTVVTAVKRVRTPDYLA